MKTGIKLLKVRGKQSFSGTEGNVKPFGKYGGSSKVVSTTKKS